MKFDLKPGDTALVLFEQSLGYGGHYHAAVPREVARVTPTQVVIGSNRYRKDDGTMIGGRGRLLDPVNPTDYGSRIDIITEDEAKGIYSKWRLFEDAIRNVLGRQAPAHGLGNMFDNAELRNAVVEEAARHSATITALIKQHKTS